MTVDTATQTMMDELLTPVKQFLQCETCSNQQILTTVLEVNQYNRSDSLGVNPLLY
ncbi:TPA: hypothetical protein ACX6SX_001845 [Photobacterium damselae]